jgi:predicted CoA-binding protein
MNKTLVFGASLKPYRYSNMAVKRLVDNRTETEAFGLKAGIINGVEIKTKLDNFEDIDTISMYVGKKNQPMYYENIIKINPRRIIFNPGTENPEFYKILKDNGIAIEEACTLVLLSTGQY